MTSSFLKYSFYKILMKIRPTVITVLLKKILGIKRFIIEIKQGQFYIDPVSNFGLSLLEKKNYESDMTVVLKSVLKPSFVFLDIGANEGYFSVIASKIVGSSGKVIAVEPQKRAQQILIKNLQLNNVKNVSIVTEAISNIKGEAVLHVSPNTNTGSSGLARATKYTLQTQIVNTITLDDLFKKEILKKVDLIKMDIEGYEYEAIVDSNVFKEKKIKAIALEMHPVLLERRGLKSSDITRFLLDCGYIIDKNFSELVFSVL